MKNKKKAGVEDAETQTEIAAAEAAVVEPGPEAAGAEVPGAEAPDPQPAFVAPSVPTAQTAEPDPTPLAPAPSRAWLPSTAAGKSRLVAAAVAGVFLLGGGIAGYAIGQTQDGPENTSFSRPGLEADHPETVGGPGGRPGGPGGGPGGVPGADRGHGPGQQDQQQDQRQDRPAPDTASEYGTPSSRT